MIYNNLLFLLIWKLDIYPLCKTTNKHELLLRSVNITNFTEYFGCPKDSKIVRDLSLLDAQMSD